MNSNTETVSLYVHIPFCRSKCLYCAFYSEPVEGHDADALIDAILTELDKYSRVSKFDTVYIGGGTPTSLGARNLLRLVKALADRCTGFKEFTVEANPGQLDEEFLKLLRQGGVNRLSIGAQSFDPAELKLLGRTHSVADTTTAVKSAKRAGFENTGLDLIFAIPASTERSWRHSLDSAVELDVQHISAYALTWEKDTPLYEAFRAGRITPVDEETDRAMYELAIKTLKQAGFVHYEISNFARTGLECLHNLKYWASEPFIGIGPAAASWYGGKRSTNITDIGEYVRKICEGQAVAVETETPSAVELPCQTAVLNLRRIRGIDLGEFKRHTGYDLLELFGKEIEQNKRLGLLEEEQGRIRLSTRALPIADSVLADFATV